MDSDSSTWNYREKKVNELAVRWYAVSSKNKPVPKLIE